MQNLHESLLGNGSFSLSRNKKINRKLSRGKSPGGVLNISLGGEVRHGPSYPDPV